MQGSFNLPRTPGWIAEFRAFIARGNVVDLAIGIIIGVAFTTVVGSFVKDVINPVIGVVIGGVDFSNVFVALNRESYPTLDAAQKGIALGFLTAVRDAQVTFPAGRWAPFLTNHDQPRVMTRLAGNAAQARIAAIAMLTLPGTPFVYYGEEIGMRGDKPDEQIRTPMQWSAGTGAGFTLGRPWEDPQPDWRTTNVAAQEGDSASLLNLYRRLIHLRLDHAALRGGDLVLASANDNGAGAFVRHAPEETVLVVLNFSARNIDRLDVALDASDCGAGACRLQPLFGGTSAADVRVSAAGTAASVELRHLAAQQGYVFQILRP